MDNYFDILPGEERIIARLTKLYGSYGFTKYKMRKFEEYSLYLENKSFLSSEYVLTFSDLNGKLLALKPDVTLSIVKNAKASADSSEKFYYHEKVYRPDRHSREYREITQMGLEFIGAIDEVGQTETVVLALKTLETVDEDYLLDISHMGIIEGLIKEAGITASQDKADFIGYIRAKNAHDLKRLPAVAALSEEKRTGLVAALTATGTGRGALESLKAFSDETLVSAVKELERLFAVLDKSGYRDKVRFDLSLLNALDYYNGIIFQGYVKKVPHSVLSGGRYDRLIAKFCPGGIGATGFAIYLSELNAYYSGGEGITDALLIYKDGDDPYLVEKKAAKLRETGLSVRVEKAPADGVKAKTVIKFEV